MLFNDVIAGEDINLIETFYNRDGQQRGQFKTGKEWALRSYWDDIRGNANENGTEASMPSELVLRHLMLYTRQDEIVFEPFCGAGTTVVACESLKRKCRAMEISPAYAAVTIQRYLDATMIEPRRVQ